MEKELIQAAKSGDKQAMAALYQQHVQAIYRYVMARVNDTHVAEDITSDVFVRALETLPHYEQQGIPFLGWLYRIASGKIVDHYRWSGRRASNQALDEHLPDMMESPEQQAFRSAQIREMMAHLQSLTTEQQQVLMLRFVQGHSISQTAELMGKNENAVKALQFRAMQTLARLMGDRS